MMSEAKSQGVLALLDQYKDEKSLRAFAEAQMKTITQLSKKVNELEKKNTQLETLIQQTTPLIKDEKVSSVQTEGLLTTDEEAIVTIQLNRLRDISMERDLTLEESKKLDVYYKILNSIRNQPKTIVVESRKLSTEELMALASTLNQPDEK